MTGESMNNWTLSLRECRWIYERYFNRPLPPALAYDDAAGQVLAACGARRFAKLVAQAKEAVHAERVEDGTITTATRIDL